MFKFYRQLKLRVFLWKLKHHKLKYNDTIEQTLLFLQKIDELLLSKSILITSSQFIQPIYPLIQEYTRKLEFFSSKIELEEISGQYLQYAKGRTCVFLFLNSPTYHQDKQALLIFKQGAINFCTQYKKLQQNNNPVIETNLARLSPLVNNLNTLALNLLEHLSGATIQY